MTPLRPLTRRLLLGVGYAVTVLIPLLPLFPNSVIFPQDWTNHQWMVGYYGDYFREHGTLPTVFNTAPAAGMAWPVFYAWLLYPLLGVLAAVTGSALALRLAVAGLIAIQFFALLAAGRKIFGQPWLAYLVAASVIWGTYALTNLYNRGALAEFFATGFFVTALGLAALAFEAASASARWFHGWLAGVFLLLTIGTHPPTALLAAGFVGLLAAGWVAADWRKLGGIARRGGLRLAGAALVGAVIVAPWVYANVLFAGKLSVTRGVGDFIFRPANCDSIFARFAPFPFDGLTWKYGDDGSGTAYLEAPVNAVLLGLLLWNLMLIRRSRSEPVSSPGASPGVSLTLAVAMGWFAFLAVLSLAPGFAGFFRFFAPYIQYAYRLVSHCNAALLVAVFASGALVARQAGYRRYQHETNLVGAVLLVIAFLGVGLKLHHAAVMARPADYRPASAARRLAETAHAYDVPGGVRILSREEARGAFVSSFPVGKSGAAFGEAGPVSVDLSKTGWVKTNAVVFPWLEFQCDGKFVPAGQLAQSDQFLAVQLPLGRHELRLVWRPDSVWLGLYRCAQVLFALVLVTSVIWSAVRLRQLFARPSARAAE